MRRRSGHVRHTHLLATVLAILLAVILQLAAHANELSRYEFTEPHMGVPFTLLFYADNDAAANKAAGAAFARIEALNRIMSDYDPESELSRLSRTSGSGRHVTVSRELWQVLVAAQSLSEKTDGAFDVTVGPAVKLWRRARRAKKMPSAELLEKARAAVGYRHLQLDKERKLCTLTQPGMRLDLGGIAKGYAADEALRVLHRHGIDRALVNASGDIAIGAPPPGKPGWKIGVAPLEAAAPPSEFLLLEHQAVATSGDAWQFVEIDGRRYSHIIDPHTALGLTTRSSVTVVAADGMSADSLASAVSVLGPERGLQLIEKTAASAALIVTRKEGKVQTYESARMKLLPRAENPSSSQPN